MNSPDWIKGKFNETQPSWESGLDTQKEVESIKSILGLTGVEKILDLGCGKGRHAVILARLGCDVTAIDLSEVQIASARGSMQKLKASVDFRCGNYLLEKLPSEFDVVLNLYDGGVGYFDDKRNKQVFDVISKALKLGGYHFMNVLNRDYFEKKCPFRTWKITEDCLILTEYKIKGDRLIQAGSVIRYGEALSKPVVNKPSFIKLYSPGELEDELRRVGLALVSLEEDFNFNDISSSGGQMAVLSKKVVG